MSTYFVVRDTNHPTEDIKRNWSSVIGGWDVSYFVGNIYNTEDEAKTAWFDFHDGEEYAPKRCFRFHPAYGSYVPVHYEGLGAWILDAENISDALTEAALFGDDLACTCDKGDGHFFAEDVVSFHEVRPGKYIFEIKY